MPKLNPAKTKTYGTGEPVDNRKTFRDRLMDRFASHEYVRIINIDNVPVQWQYLPSHKEEKIETPDRMKQIYRGDVEVYLLNPGESEVLIGECAYLALENMYKQVAARKSIERSPNTDSARNFNFSDAGAQEDFLERAYIGKESPNFSTYDLKEEEDEKEKPKKRTTTEQQLKKHLREQTA